MQMATYRNNYTFSNHVDTVMYTLTGNAQTASEDAADAAVDAIQHQMLYGYKIPHGRDHHTEILDTGRLFDSIVAEVVKVSENTWETRAGASNEAGRMEDVSYAVYVHDGTSKMSARPFIRDALMDEEFQNRIQQIFVDDLRQGF